MRVEAGEDAGVDDELLEEEADLIKQNQDLIISRRERMKSVRSHEARVTESVTDHGAGKSAKH